MILIKITQDYHFLIYQRSGKCIFEMKTSKRELWKGKKKAGRRTKGKGLDTSTTAVYSMSYWENSEFTSEYDVDYDDILPNEKKYLI